MKSNFRDSPVWFARMMGLLFSLAVLSGTTMPVGEFQIFEQAPKEKYPLDTIFAAWASD